MLCSIDEADNLLRIPAGTARKWCQQMGFPEPDSVGRYDLDRIIGWGLTTGNLEGGIDPPEDTSENGSDNPLTAIPIATTPEENAITEVALPVVVEWVTVTVPIVRDSASKLIGKRQSVSLLPADEEIKKAYGKLRDGCSAANVSVREERVDSWSAMFRYIGDQLRLAIENKPPVS